MLTPQQIAEAEAFLDESRPSRQQIIAITEPLSQREQQALAAAMIERTKAERYELTLREAYLYLNSGNVAMARYTITKTVIVIHLLVALAACSFGDEQPTNAPAPSHVALRDSPALDAPGSTNTMPGRTNGPTIAERIKRPVVRPPAGTNAPITLQSAQPQPVAPTFADGVRLGVMASRRNQDVGDINLLFQIAASYWNQEQQQKAAQQPQKAP